MEHSLPAQGVGESPSDGPCIPLHDHVKVFDWPPQQQVTNAPSHEMNGEAKRR